MTTTEHLPPMALQLVWTVAPATPAVDSHAELLRAVAGEVYKQPFGSYEGDDRLAAAEELLAALQSQLPRDATGEIPVPADFDERQAVGEEGLQVGPLLALYRTGLFNGERGLAHLEHAVAGAVGVAWGPPNPDQNPTMPGWEQCTAHLLDDLRTGRTEAVLDPAAVGRLIFPDDDPPDCARCNAQREYVARVPGMPREAAAS